MLIKRILYLLALLVLPAAMFAQVTTSSMTGFVKSQNGEALIGATIKAVHTPTGTTYMAASRTGGRFDIQNMNPGGPYTVEISYVNLTTFKRDDVFLTLGEALRLDAGLSNNTQELSTVIVSTRRGTPLGGKGGAETMIGRDQMANLPTVGRNLADYLRAVPQAKLTAADGGITIAGQNNRFNSFYIDGAVNNDVFGLSASGTNGGQAAIAPISIDAIDQFQVVISPYDASLGNFTGGGINAITRSGTNQVQGSAYYFFRNENLTGKTPTGDKASATKLAPFKSQTVGFRVGGPIIKNKLFYFINGEILREERPQPFDFANYRGDTKDINVVNNFINTLINTYSYDPGRFENNPEEAKANRIVTKLDWNISSAHKLSLSYRYNQGERYNTSTSSNTALNFYNNGYIFPTKTNSLSAELNSNLGAGKSNKLLVTYTSVLDDRGPLGDPFPRVTIFDGDGRFVFGTEANSTQNKLKQNNFSLFDAFKINKGKHLFTFGTDNEFNTAYNVFIQNTFGTYEFSSLSSFLNNSNPTFYRRGYSLIDNSATDQTASAAEFETMRLGLFVSDEFKVNEKFTLNYGVRADYNMFMKDPKEDPYFNETALPVFSQYYDFKGARAGQKPNMPVSISPRLGFTYKIDEENLVIRGGAGMFTGRIPLVWPGGIYNNTGLGIASFTVSSSSNSSALPNIFFRPDPAEQYTAQELGLGVSKGTIDLVSKKFRAPKVFRTSLAVDKKFGEGWRLTLEGIFTKNINETFYTNANILPPTLTSAGPDGRMVYPSPAKMPFPSGSNPYDNVMILSNNDGPKGYGYNFTTTIDKRFNNGFSINVNYTWGDSWTLHEATSSVNLSQWANMEAVNSRNNLTRSRSDFSQGHRIFSYISKKFTYAQKRLATTISLVYTGQSGNPLSYTYNNGSPIRDGASNFNDLIYIPTATEVQSMTFLSNTVGSTTYTEAQQREGFEQFIQNNKYLNSRRGQFAERNGDRLPFTNLLDLKIAQDFNLKLGGKTYGVQVSYDIFNFTNMLNRDWGRSYFASFDQYQPLQFAGYTTGLVPRYRFNPANINADPYTVSTSTVPNYSARWVSQLGFRINF